MSQHTPEQAQCLIATAPELLRAAKRIVIGVVGQNHPDWYEGIFEDAYEELVNAIDKAEGKG